MRRLRYSGQLLRQLFKFARAHKVYWIIPLVLILALTIALIVTGQSSAPFIYTLF